MDFSGLITGQLEREIEAIESISLKQNHAAVYKILLSRAIRLQKLYIFIGVGLIHIAISTHAEENL